MRLPAHRPPLAPGLLLFALAACQGGGGGGGLPSPAPVGTQDPGGLYSGTVTNSTDGVTADSAAIVDEAGDFQLVSGTDGYQYSGQLAVSGTGATGAFRFYDSQGTFVTTGAFTGTVVTHSKIVGTFTLADGHTGSLSLAYANDYASPSALASVAGKYVWQSSRNNLDANLTVNADGTVSGITEYGCGVTGSLGLLDARYSPFRLSLTAASSPPCGAAGGKTLTGFANFAPAAGGTPAELVAIATADTAGTFADYGPQTDTETVGGLYNTGALFTRSGPANGDNAQAEITEGGALQLFDTTSNLQYSGQLSISGTSATGALRVYDATGKYLAMASLYGSVHKHDRSNGFEGTIIQASGERDAFGLRYTTGYETPTSLTTAAGNYTSGPYVNSHESGAKITLNSNGTMAGTTAGGCAFTGTAAVADSRYDLFTAQLVFPSNSACGAAAGATLTGTLAYLPAVPGASSTELSLYASSPGAAYYATYLLTSRTGTGGTGS